MIYTEEEEMLLEKYYKLYQFHKHAGNIKKQKHYKRLINDLTIVI